jgi:Ankyrin repeats (3 copies)/Ankyrin repeat
MTYAIIMYSLLAIKIGYTPLHTVALYGQTEVCKILLAAGVNVNAITIDAYNMHIGGVAFPSSESENLSVGKLAPLHLAALFGHVQVCELLLAAGAHVNQQDREGKAPLHWAAARGHLRVCNALLAAGADVSVQNTLGNTPLHEAASCCPLPACELRLCDAASRERLPVCKLLLGTGADISVRNHGGHTPAEVVTEPDSKNRELFLYLKKVEVERAEQAAFFKRARVDRD